MLGNKKLILIIIIFSLIVVFILITSNLIYAKTCKEAYDECVIVHAFDYPFGSGLVYCTVGYLWCITFME